MDGTLLSAVASWATADERGLARVAKTHGLVGDTGQIPAPGGN